MSKIARWIGSDGDILVPLNTNAIDNSGKLYSVNTGVLYFSQLEPTSIPIQAGMPMGLLLSLTYSSP
jgi:hypothetical protein